MTIAWSPDGEARLRRRIANTRSAAILFLICAWGSFMLTILHRWFWWLVPMAGFVVLTLIALHELESLVEILGEPMHRGQDGSFHEGSGMLANKPRSSANLTRWCDRTQHPSSPHFNCPFFTCECGKIHMWQDAQWIRNYDPEQFDGETAVAVDPDGGRYVILCPCGIGHYKLKS